MAQRQRPLVAVCRGALGRRLSLGGQPTRREAPRRRAPLDLAAHLLEGVVGALAHLVRAHRAARPAEHRLAAGALDAAAGSGRARLLGGARPAARALLPFAARRLEQLLCLEAT